MNAADPELLKVLRRLKLGQVIDTLPARVAQAAADGMPPAEFLFRVLRDEVDRRDGKRLQNRLDKAGFEPGKTLEDFDWTFNARLPRGRLLDLGACAFVDQKQAVILVGPAGVGKSHLAQALGHRAVRRGHSVVFTTAVAMFNALRAGRGDGSFERRFHALIQPEVLVIDDLGERPPRFDEPDDLCQLVRGRYERGATIITSNLAIPEWAPLFGGAVAASAALDRLLHNAVVLELDGESHRTSPRARKKG